MVTEHYTRVGGRDNSDGELGKLSWYMNMSKRDWIGGDSCLGTRGEGSIDTNVTNDEQRGR